MEEDRKEQKRGLEVSVLVLEGAKPASLAIVRSLGKRGIDVTVGESVGFCSASLSKYCKNHIRYPAPERDLKSFIEALLAEVKRRQYEVVYPVAGETTLPIAMYKDKLTPYVKVPLPDYEIIKKADDKAETLQIAKRLGIPCPRTYFVDSLKQVEKIVKQAHFPLVIKPRHKLRWSNDRLTLTKVTKENYVFSRGELRTKYQKIHRRSSFPLIQEYIPGQGYGFAALFDRGEPKAVFMHKRLREFPVTGGASTLRESIYCEEMRQLGEKLLRAMNWHGVAMVEFKLDERDHKFKLMEINGRWWGSLPLAIASGVDFPYLLHKLTVDGVVNSNFKYREGVRCRLLVPNDLLWFLQSLRNQTSKVRVIREFSKFRNMSYDILSVDDPLPTLGALGGVFRRLAEIATGKASICGGSISFRSIL